MNNFKKAKEINPITDDSFQFFNDRECQTTALDVEVEDILGFLSDPFDCNSKFIQFTSGVDFTTVEPEFPSIEIDREDVSSNSVLNQTDASKMSYSLTMPILVKSNSRLFQYIANFNANEYTSGRNGRGVIALSNGGIQLIRKLTFNKGKANEFTLVTAAVNAKFSSWWDNLNGEVTSDTTFDFEIMVERWNIYQAIGTLPSGYGQPSNIADVTIDYTGATLTDTDLTVSAITLNDPDMFADSANVFVKTFDDEGLVVDEGIVPAGSDYVYSGDFTSTDKFFVSLNYKVSDTLMYSTVILEITKTTSVNFKEDKTTNVKKSKKEE